MEILIYILVALVVIKIYFWIFHADKFENFSKSYFASVNRKPWLYHNIYISLGLLFLYFIRQAGVSYVNIFLSCLFMSFMINAAFTSFPNIFENFDLKKINKGRISIYTGTFIYIMFKAVQELLK